MAIEGLKIGELGTSNANGQSVAALRLTDRLPNLAVGNFSKRNHHFAIIRINEGFGSLKKLPRSFRGQHNQFKTVVNVLQAIFNGDPGHLATPLVNKPY
jgi:hypothetical protein